MLPRASPVAPRSSPPKCAPSSAAIQVDRVRQPERRAGLPLSSPGGRTSRVRRLRLRVVGRVVEATHASRKPRPARYLGLDLHRRNDRVVHREPRAASAKGFRCRASRHRTAPASTPDGRADVLPLPLDDSEITLFNAFSVFTHTVQDQAEYYLREAVRVLRPTGALHATWFLFDKTAFPMMQDFQNALVHQRDRPVQRRSSSTVTGCFAPREMRVSCSRGQSLETCAAFSAVLVMRPIAAGQPEIQLPEETAPPGVSAPRAHARPTRTPSSASTSGLDHRRRAACTLRCLRTAAGEQQNSEE